MIEKRNKLVAFPLDVLEKLEQSARKNHRSVTKEIVYRIEESLSNAE